LLFAFCSVDALLVASCFIKSPWSFFSLRSWAPELFPLPCWVPFGGHVGRRLELYGLCVLSDFPLEAVGLFFFFVEKFFLT